MKYDKSNSDIPDIPEWPFIFISDKKGECLVTGKHQTEKGFKQATNMGPSLGCFGLILAFVVGGASAMSELAAFIFILAFILLCFFSSKYGARYYSKKFSSKETVVGFKKDLVVINRREYKVTPGTQIVFQSNRPALSEEEQETVWSKSSNKEYAKIRFRFRKLEMVYGMNPQLIADMEQDEAEKFVIVLTFAFQYAQQYFSNEQPQMTKAKKHKPQRGGDYVFKPPSS